MPLFKYSIKMSKLKQIWSAISPKRQIIWISAFAGLLILTGSNYFWADMNARRTIAFQEKEKQEKPQKDDLLNFVKEITSKNLKAINTMAAPKLKSKIIVFINDPDKSLNWVSELNNKFPENVIAKNKNELKTIIEVKQQKKPVARYTDGSQGYMYIFIISVIDVAQQAVIFTKEIRGGEPPSTKRGRGGTEYGSYPSDEVVNYVKNLTADF